MSRLSTRTNVLRALFARSGNQCFFPRCQQKIINYKNQFIGQICHIEAANKKGARYNYSSNDEYRRCYQNLLILCYEHHVETDDVADFPVSKMTEIKNNHERLFEDCAFNIDEKVLDKLSLEFDQYWLEIEQLNKREHIMSELAMEINTGGSFSEVLESVHLAIVGIRNVFDALHNSDENIEEEFKDFISQKSIDVTLFDNVPYWENPFINRNWELHNLAVNNHLQRLQIDLDVIEAKYWEEYLKTNPSDNGAMEKYNKIKAKIKGYAQSVMHTD